MKMIKPIELLNDTSHFTFPEWLEQLSDSLHLPHVTSGETLGQLEASSHKANGDAFFGAGNSTAHYLMTFDHTSNIEFGLEDHYRTGDYVNPIQVAIMDPNARVPTVIDHEWRATMDKGAQNGLHNEQGTNLTRSAASFDFSMNFGNEAPTDGKFVLDINGHDYTLKHAGAQWFFENAAHSPVFGATLSPDGHVLQDSINFGFGEFSYLAHASANSGDLKAQDIHVSLTEMVGAVGVAQVTETIHLV